jgi:hypothetical protein
MSSTGTEEMDGAFDVLFWAGVYRNEFLPAAAKLTDNVASNVLILLCKLPVTHVRPFPSPSVLRFQVFNNH